MFLPRPNPHVGWNGRRNHLLGCAYNSQYSRTTFFIILDVLCHVFHIAKYSKYSLKSWTLHFYSCLKWRLQKSPSYSNVHVNLYVQWLGVCTIPLYKLSISILYSTLSPVIYRIAIYVKKTIRYVLICFDICCVHVRKLL